MKLRPLDAVLTASYALLWTGGVVSHFLWRRTPPDAEWTASAFLACAAALLVSGRTGGRGWLLWSAAAGFAVELAGSRLGFPFGRYSYSTSLSPLLAGVPAVMGCAWMILLAYVKSGLQGMPLAPHVALFAGAAWMTAIDTVIDPVASAVLGYWRWEEPGWYYGVPLSNFAGWLATSALLLASGARVRLAGPRAGALGRSILVFFGLIAWAHRMAAPAAAAFVLCALDLALGRMRRRIE